ncbi:hypothetical protein C2W62_46065 [Candidatus Entotheonella serta]|nr:hypothetical protein C2W62_46065 [Candidatus Entotheonella serta]
MANGEAVQHLYEAPGVYTVQLTVTDTDGATDTTTASVIVESAAPEETLEVFDIGPVADSYAYELQANTSFGERSIMQIRGARKDRITYLKFNVRQAPSGPVRRAELEVYASYVSSGATVPITVVGVDDDQWTETGLTWNRAPALGDALDRLNIREKGWYAFDVTPFVAEQLAGDQIVSLAFLDDQERDRLVNLWSRKRSATSRY